MILEGIIYRSKDSGIMEMELDKVMMDISLAACQEMSFACLFTSLKTRTTRNCDSILISNVADGDGHPEGRWIKSYQNK